jgi:hypothetical protein
VAAEGDGQYEVSAEVQRGAAGGDQSPYEVVIAVAESGQLVDPGGPVVGFCENCAPVPTYEYAKTPRSRFSG